MSAIGAEPVILIKGAAASRTAGWRFVMFGRSRSGHLVDRSVAPVAKQKGVSRFYPENRDEKQAEPVIHPLHPGAGQAAGGTETRGCVKDGCFW